jgi:uncharacterized paraquat-inducible protein A
MSVADNASKSARAECPSCGSFVPVGRKVRMGQRVACPICREKLEVIWLHPVELDWPLEDEYDEYDDNDR